MPARTTAPLPPAEPVVIPVETAAEPPRITAPSPATSPALPATSAFIPNASASQLQPDQNSGVHRFSPETDMPSDFSAPGERQDFAFKLHSSTAESTHSTLDNQSYFAPEPSATIPEPPTPNPRLWQGWLGKISPSARRIGIGALAILALIGIGAFIIRPNNPAQHSLVGVAAQYNTLSLPLAQFVQQGVIVVRGNQSLNINGQLIANNSLIIAPTSQPANAIKGQIYYDQGTNQLAYFNGSQFVAMQPTADTITGVGSGLALAGGALSNTGVLSVQGTSGAVTFSGGAGIAVNGTVIANTGVIGLGGQTGAIGIGNGLSANGNTLTNTGVVAITTGTPNLVATSNGAGTITLSSIGGGSGTVTSGGGTVNRLAKFTGAQNIENSLVSDDGTTVTIGGNTSITGTLTVSAPLGVASGGTGAGSLAANGVIIGQGTGALSSVTAGGAGLCLMSNAGAPSFQACPSGSGGVASLNAATGALSIANASESGGVITLNDASTSSKGIASFASANFSVASGAVNTVQDINISAAPTFGRLTLTSSQASNPMLLVNNTNGGATGNLLDLQQNGVSRLAVTPAGNVTLTGTVNGQTIGSAANFTGTITAAGAANLNGGANVSGILSANTVTPTGAMTIGATAQNLTMQGATVNITATSGANTASLAFVAPTANVTYRLQAAAAGTYDVCTTAGNCVGTGGGVSTSGGTTNRLTKFTGSQTIGDSIITDNGSTVSIAGTLGVNTITPSSAMTVGAATQNLTLQGAAVALSSTSGGITNSLTFATPSGGNKTITIPNASGTVALNASGPLAIDAAGTITCASCVTSGGGSGGVGAVDSVNGLTGTLNINNSSGVGTTITINDASTSQKGIAQFNSTNFSAGSGTINTVQDINTTAAPTFGRLAVTSSQASNDMLSVDNTNAGGTGSLLKLQLNGANRFTVDPAGNVVANGTITAGTFNGQTISSAANFTGSVTVSTTLAVNTITPSGAMTVGTTSQNLTLQGAATTITATSGANTTTLTLQTPSANVTYRLLTAAAGTYDICTTVGNCTGGNVSTSGGTTGRIAKFTGANTIADSLLSESGSTVTAGGNLNITTGNQFQVNGSQISSANLSNDANIAKLDATQIFTGGTNTFRNTTNSTSAVSIQNAAGDALLTVDSTNSRVGIAKGGANLPAYALDVTGDINSTTSYRIAGAAGASTTCSGGQLLQNQVVNGGIVTGGSCVAAGSSTLQTAYTASTGGTTPEVKLDSTRTGLDIQDADSTIGSNAFLLGVRGSNGSGLGALLLGVEGGGDVAVGASDATARLHVSSAAASTLFKVTDATASAVDVLTIADEGAVTFQNRTDSTTAFQINSSGGTNMFVIDSTNSRAYIGSPTADATGALLVLDTKNTTGDPTGVAGAMYYNSALGRMRCHVDATWRYCNDPVGMRWGYNFQEEFIGSVDIGIGWREATGTSGSIIPLTSDVPNRPGQIRLSTGTDTSSGFSAAMIDSGTDLGTFWIQGGEEIEFAIKVNNLADGTTDYDIRGGICDQPAFLCDNGVYIEYDRDASTNWRIGAAKATVLSETSSSKAVATGWTSFRIVANSTSSIDYYAKHESDSTYTFLGNVSTNIPNTSANQSMAMVHITKDIGSASTARTIDFDYFAIRNSFTSAR